MTLLQEMHWGDLLDIGLASGLIWCAIHALLNARTRRVGIGLLLFGMVIFAANQLDLKLTVWILQGITAVIILIVVVVYQSEIRRLLERFPASLLNRDKINRAASAELVDLLTTAAGELSGARRGALIVLPGADLLDGLITSGNLLGGQLSKSLLLSIFDPNSPGHDGALIVRGDLVERFGSRLPLSDQDEQLKERGTRHAAALGLSEKSDALVMVVSEETGRISLARNGNLWALADPEALRFELGSFLEEHTEPVQQDGRFKKMILRGGLEAGAALLVAALLWLVLVPGSVVQMKTYEVAVEVQNIPEGYDLASVTPPTVAVILAGETRNLFQVKPADLVIRLDGTLTRFGRQTFPITNAHLLLPPKVEIADVVPDQVRVTVQKVN
ncbi:MAG: diadenylate cyclase [Proteobacteria bacterium]|nr:diadenylate cyclase [Pseudomonadota bacterium]